MEGGKGRKKGSFVGAKKRQDGVRRLTYQHQLRLLRMRSLSGFRWGNYRLRREREEGEEGKRVLLSFWPKFAAVLCVFVGQKLFTANCARELLKVRKENLTYESLCRKREGDKEGREKRDPLTL